MSLSLFASTFALVSFTVLASAEENCRDPYANQTIQWVACGTTNQPTLECGTLDVPIDYTDLSAGSLTLPVVRVPAIGSSPRGSILTNPGGPGVSGIEDVVNSGDVTQQTTGTDFHIVSWDPRGVGLTTPYTCPNVDTAPGYGMPLDTEEGLNATYVTNVNQGLYCNQTDYEASQLVGTAFTARDAMSIVNALGEDGMIRYWGSSYGTLLGSTIAAMFPDKIDRMILDGNINPTDYYHGLNEESVDDVDAALSNFFELCVSAGPDYCALANGASTAKELEQEYLDFLAGYANGSYVFTDSTNDAWDYNRVKGYLYGDLKYPSKWPTTSQQVYNFYAAKNYGTTGAKREAPFNPLDATSDPKGQYNTLNAITCGDWDDVPGNGTLQDYSDWLKLYESRSSYGGDQLITILYSCAVWKVNAKEKYTGSFENVKTANPIFFINGHFDPVTPLMSAQNSSSGFVGSGLLNTNIAGHCSTAQDSKCVKDKIASYFDTGKLPDLTEQCYPDTAAFLPQNATNANNETVRRRTLEHDPNFEYPAAIRHLKRSIHEVLLEKRQSSSTQPNCTSLATRTGSSAAATSSSSSSSDSNGAMGRHVDASTLTLFVLAIMSAIAPFL